MRYVIYHTTGNLPAAEMYLGVDSFIIAGGVLDLDNIAIIADRKSVV
jgi:hypothetical protein